MTETRINAALFHNSTRLFRNISVDLTDTQAIAKNPVTGDVLATYNLVETVKAGEAWEALNADGSNAEAGPFRLVVQLGCGCSGQKPYQPDAEWFAAHPEAL